MMSWVHIHPRYQELLRRRGLTSVQDFLRLGGVILCGHADRHVLHIDLDSLPFALFLKKEHRIPWRERLASFRAGFGFVSRSAREARQLQLLQEAGIDCPEVLAVGEKSGQAFLLLREQAGARDLRHFLAQHPAPENRRRLACDLGRCLARMHAAGFAHPELFAKHILVTHDGKFRFCFLDWQRSHVPRPLSEKERLGNLAALDASLIDALASPNDRLACLRSYLRELAAKKDTTNRPRCRPAFLKIRRLSAGLLKQARVRELRQPPLPRGEQNLIWLDGERVCITRQFQEDYPAQVQTLLQQATFPLPPGQLRKESRPDVNLHLTRFHTRSFGQWLFSWIRRRTLVSPAFQQAAHIFRLQRHGIPTPRLLAVGQDFLKPWHTASFLLTEQTQPSLPLRQCFQNADSCQRWQLLRRAARFLRCLHQAGYQISSLKHWTVGQQGADPFNMVLTRVDDLVRAKTGFRRNLRAIWKELSPGCTRTDLLRFLLAYQGRDNLKNKKPSVPQRRSPLPQTEVVT